MYSICIHETSLSGSYNFKEYKKKKRQEIACRKRNGGTVTRSSKGTVDHEAKEEKQKNKRKVHIEKKHTRNCNSSI
jgi:hypothetical protein